MRSKQLRIAFLLFLLPLIGTACDSSDEPVTDSVTVALLDGRPQTLGELQLYLEANMLTQEGRRASAGDDDQVKSRLFDAFIDERLLLGEAERRKVQVADREIDASLALDGEESEAAVRNATWQEARRRLMIQKLLERVLLEQAPISEEEVRAHVEQNGETLGAGRRVRMRNLMLASEEEAQRIYRELRRRRLTFDEAAVNQQAGPGQRVPVEVRWENLSEELRAALEELRPGQVSRPVEQGGSFYLFRVEAWLSDSEEALLRAARSELEGRKRQEAQKELIKRLRQSTKIRVKLRNLPFDYRPANRG